MLHTLLETPQGGDDTGHSPGPRGHPTVSCELHLGSDHTEDGVGSKDEKVPAQWEVPSVMIS